MFKVSDMLSSFKPMRNKQPSKEDNSLTANLILSLLTLAY